jgi:uncharacterized repeat protein (TIGR01451 family)
MTKLLKFAAPLLLGLAIPAAASAQGTGLVLDSIVELEKSETVADGTTRTSYTKPDVVVPGDRVRITLRFHNRGREPINNLKLNNPIPAGLQFDGSNDLAGFSLSVDGGTNFGQLSDLILTASDGTQRAANMGDVTHIMWILPEPVAPGGRGSVTFFTRVR